MTERANFSLHTKQLLASRAGHRCSFPPCGRPTSGPSSESESATANTGEAAHIIAASCGPGARRARPDVSDAEKAHIDNGIWMCRTHAKLVDTDEMRFTIEMLREWRQLAEEKAQILQENPHADVRRVLSKRKLTPHSVEIPSIDGAGQVIGEMLDDCCIRSLWGEDVCLATRDALIEVAKNAFTHGGASEVSVTTDRQSIVMRYDGGAFDPRNLATVENPRGGAKSLELLGKQAVPVVTRWSRDGDCNVFQVGAPRTPSDVVDGFRPCSTQIRNGRHGTLDSEVILDSCEAVYVVLPRYMTFSDVFDISIVLKSVLEQGQAVTAFYSDLSAGCVNTLVEQLPEAHFAPLIDSGDSS